MWPGINILIKKIWIRTKKERKKNTLFIRCMQLSLSCTYRYKCHLLSYFLNQDKLFFFFFLTINTDLRDIHGTNRLNTHSHFYITSISCYNLKNSQAKNCTYSMSKICCFSKISTMHANRIVLLILDIWQGQLYLLFSIVHRHSINDDYNEL